MATRKIEEKLLLVLCDSNYADEFDVQGFSLWRDSAWKEYLKMVKDSIFSYERDGSDESGPHVASIGTNEAIGFDDFAAYKECFKTKVIDEDEAKRLGSLFKISLNKKITMPPSAYGMFLALDPFYEEEGEDEDEEEYEEEDEEEED